MTENPLVAPDTEVLDDDEKLSKFMLDIATDANVVDVQRDRANEDMRFVFVQGGMWEGFLSDQDVADRIRLEFDTVGDYVFRFLGEWNSNAAGVEFISDDATPDDDAAEIVNGIYRADYREFGGKTSVKNAILEAATCGFGAFKVATAFDDEGDPENDDQHMTFRPVYDAYNAIYYDQAAQWIDYRDARHVTELNLFSFESFDDEYPGESPVSAYAPINRSFENQNTAARQEVYVATRYEVKKRKKTFFVYNNLAEQRVESYEASDHELIAKELRANPAIKFVRKREVIKRVIERTVFSGNAILEPTREIAGEWLPIIPVFAYRAYVDGVPWYHGLVRNLKDAARLFNMQMSKVAETTAGGGEQIPIFEPEQMENPQIRADWADKTNKSILMVESVKDEQGNALIHGPVGYTQPPVVDPNGAAILDGVSQYIQNKTGGAPQETLDPRISGKAFVAAVKRMNMNTQPVMENFEEAIAWSGRVYQSQASAIYTGNRILRTLGQDGKTNGSVQLNQLQFDKETGRVIEANVIRGKKFRVHAESGPQYETLREQTTEELLRMIEMMSNSPMAQTEKGQKYLTLMMQMMIESTNGVGLNVLKEAVRKDMIAEGLIQPETDDEKAFLAQIQKQQQTAAQEGNPQEELIKAATEQAQAEGRNLDAASIQKIMDARKKQAETHEILTGIGQSQEELDIKGRQQVIDVLKDLPIEATP